MPPSAITGRAGFLRRLDRVRNRGELRHADTGDHPRGADRARADPDLDGISAGIDQRLGALGRGDIAGHDLHGVRHALDAADGIQHAPRMAVRGIDNDQIDAGVDERFAARVAGLADIGRGGDPQPALLVLAGIRICHRLFDILHRDQADATIVAVDHQKLLDPVLVQQALGLGLADALAHRDEIVLGHQLGDFLPAVGGETHVAVGENADEPAGAPVAAALDHRNAGNAMLLHQPSAHRRASHRDEWSPGSRPCPIRIS